MYEYIVTWVLTITFMVACPDSNKTNEFGIISNSMISFAVSHFDSKQEAKIKIFKERDSAFAFYKRAKKYEKSQSEMWMRKDKMNYIKIDSVLKIKFKEL